MKIARFKNKTFTDNENMLIEIINEAKTFVKGELELDCIDDEWYAMDYREYHGGVFPIENEKYKSPIITNAEIESSNIDLIKCFNACYVHYVGP